MRNVRKETEKKRKKDAGSIGGTSEKIPKTECSTIDQEERSKLKEETQQVMRRM